MPSTVKDGLKDNRDCYARENYSDYGEDNAVSRSIYAVVQDDLNLLKTALPTFKGITDDHGYSLLHIAIYKERPQIFDYLLSIGADIEAKCPDSNTPLLLALRLCSSNNIPITDYFVSELIRRGANTNNSLLHEVLDRKCYQSAKLLIPRESDLDCLNDNGQTALEQVIRSDMSDEEKIEFVSMLIYYGATVTHDCMKWASSYELTEFLYDYLFDENNSFVATIEQLFEVLFPFETTEFPSIIHKITHIDFEPTSYRSSGIFDIKPEYLQWLLHKFPLETREIINDHTIFHIPCTIPSKLKNIEILFESPLRDDLALQFNKRTKLCKWLIEVNEATQDDMEKFLMLLLSYGVTLQVEWLQSIYSKWGFCDLFKHLLMFVVD